MASVVSICNSALQKLGASKIQSLDDASVNARALGVAYESTRDALLRAHPWNFAIQRFQLAADATPPAFGKKNSVTLPTGWLRVLPPDPWMDLNSRDWIIEGGKLLTDDSMPLDLRCVMLVEDANLMDPAFREALASRLAIDLCEALTQSNTKKEAASQDYKNAIGEAKKANAIEQVPQIAVDGTFLTVRA
jgi:hypothetical protein